MTEKLFNHVAFTAGVGKPVVFIHGIEDDGTFWYPIDRVVAGFREVVTIDLLGFGQSDKSDALTYTLAEHVEALINTIDQRLDGGPVTLVAHSLGCYVALEYTKRHPERVKKLILVSPVIILKHKDIKPTDGFEMLQMFTLGRIGKIRRGVLKHVESEKGNQSLKNLVKSFWPSIKNVETLVEGQNVLDQFDAITEVPIVVNYGVLDPLVIKSDVLHVVGERDNVEVYAYGCGHDVVHMKPLELFKEIVPEVKESKVPDLIYKKRYRKDFKIGE